MMTVPGSARAHPGVPPEPHDLWTTWSVASPVLPLLIVGGWLYARGLRTLWRHGGRGRVVGAGQAGAYAAGLVLVAVALVSPLDGLATALLSAHMAQHLILVLAAPPLLLLGRPDLVLLWAVPASARRALGGWRHRTGVIRGTWAGLSRPAVVWALHATALWLWHVPAPYQRALTDATVHHLEHASFFLTAMLFWWVVVRAGRPGRISQGAAVLYVFSTMLQGGLLGALLTFSRTAWYPAYAGTAAAWGLTPLDDQVLAGLLMWIPGTLVYAGAGLALLAACLRSSERVERQPSGTA